MVNRNQQNSKLRKIRDYLSDNHLSIIAILVAILVGCVSIWITNYNIQRELSYQILDRSPLINQESLGDNWELRHNNQSVYNPFSVIYLIKNTGRIPIKQDDFDSSIIIKMGKDSKILSAFLSDTEPSLIKEMIEKDNKIKINSSESEQYIEIEALTLNPESSLTLKVIVDNFNINTMGSPKAIISGITEIKQDFPATRPKTKLPFPILLALIILLSLGIVIFKRNINPLVLYIALLLIGFLLGLLTVLKQF